MFPITMHYEMKNINNIDKYTLIPVLFWSLCTDMGRSHFWPHSIEAFAGRLTESYFLNIWQDISCFFILKQILHKTWQY